VRPGRFAPDALIVEEGNPLKGHGGHGLGLAEGWYVVQDEASQLVSLLVNPSAGLRVLDTCASPGGKTTAMAAAMGDRGLIVACDVRPKRIDLLKRTVAGQRVRDHRYRAGRRRAAAALLALVRPRLCSTRRARASARCDATPTYDGAGANRISVRWPPPNSV